MCGPAAFLCNDTMSLESVHFLKYSGIVTITYNCTKHADNTEQHNAQTQYELNPKKLH